MCFSHEIQKKNIEIYVLRLSVSSSLVWALNTSESAITSISLELLNTHLFKLRVHLPLVSSADAVRVNINSQDCNKINLRIHHTMNGSLPSAKNIPDMAVRHIAKTTTAGKFTTGKKDQGGGGRGVTCHIAISKSGNEEVHY